MKLYYAPGACSVSPHIVLQESGLKYEVEKVNLGEGKTESGADFKAINPKSQVPTLQLDDGSILTEGAVIVQYIADNAPNADLIAKPGTMERYRTQEWLNFTASELHKTFSPLFRPTTPDAYKATVIQTLDRKLNDLERHLKGKQYLMGDKFTVADAYCYTILRWSPRGNIDLAKYPTVKAYYDRVGARPKVQDVLKAEGLPA
jgi:glutathione S-transferase